MNEFETFIKEQKAKTSNEKKKKTSKDLAKGFNIKQNPKDLSETLKEKYGLGNNQSFLAGSQKINNESYKRFPKTNKNPGEEGLFADLGSYQKERDRLQEVRKQEYNQMLNRKLEGVREQASRSASSTPTYQNLLDKKRAQEANYRKLSGFGLPNSMNKAFSTQTLNTTSNRKRSVIHNDIFQIGQNTERDEARRKKEAYRIELLQQIDTKKRNTQNEDMSNKKAFQNINNYKNERNVNINNYNNNNNNNNHSNSRGDDSQVENISDDENDDDDDNRRVMQGSNGTTAPSVVPSFLSDLSVVSPHPIQQLQQQQQIQQQLLQQQMLQQQLLQQQLMQQQQLLMKPQQPLAYSSPANQLPSPYTSPTTDSRPAFLEDQLIDQRVQLLNSINGGQKHDKKKDKHPKVKSERDGLDSKRRLNFEKEDSRNAGILHVLGKGDDERNDPGKKREYQRQLQQQIEERRRMKEEEKRKSDLHDLKYTQQASFSDANDHLIEQVNEQALHNQPVSHSDNQPTSPPFASNLDKGTHARGGNGIFGEPMSEEQKKVKSSYQDELRKQIEDKKRREAEKKEKMKREEEEELKRMEQYNEEAKKKYEEEVKRMEEKKREEEKKAQLFIQRRDDEEKQRQEKQEERKRQREEEERLKKQAHEADPQREAAEKSAIYRPREVERPIVVKNPGRYNFEDYSKDDTPVINRSSVRSEPLEKKQEDADKVKDESPEKSDVGEAASTKGKKVEEAAKSDDVYANHSELQKLLEAKHNGVVNGDSSNNLSNGDDDNYADDSNDNDMDGDDEDDRAGDSDNDYDKRQPPASRASFTISNRRDSHDAFLSQLSQKMNNIDLEDEKRASERLKVAKQRSTWNLQQHNTDFRAKYNEIQEQLQEADMRPLSSSSLDPDELTRHNEQRLQNLKKMAGEAMESLDKYISPPRSSRHNLHYDDASDEDYWMRPTLKKNYGR